MLFDHNNIETLLSESKPFLLKDFNISVIGKECVGVEIKREFMESGTPEYDAFIEKLRKA